MLQMTMKVSGVRIVALCDLKPDRLDRAATTAARDKPTTTTEWKRIIDNKEVQAVYVATPCDLHAEMAIAALAAGKHVYCEKPAGITPEQVNALVAAARKAKTTFQIGQQMRSDARLAKTIEQIKAGAAGKIIMVKAQRHAGDDLNHQGPSADWFFDSRRSGDVIVEMSVHNLDMCNWVIGSRPARAAGFGGNLLWVNDPPGRNTMDGYSLTYEYENGVKLAYTQVFFHPNGLPNGGQTAYAYGTDGAVDVDNGTYYKRARGAQPVVLAEAGPRQNLDIQHLEVFFDCVRTGKKPFADIDVAATAALTAIMGREAIYRKRVMTWDEMGVKL
jgi:predicted dehydrogenase